MAAQTWNSLQTLLLAACVKSQPPYTVIPADFALIFPQATSYAEGRIYTDIPLLGHRGVSTSLATTPGSRTVNIGTGSSTSTVGQIIVPESFSLITPAGATPQQGTRIPFIRSTTFVIDAVWPTEATLQPEVAVGSFLPCYWAMQDYQTILYAPTADAAYTIELAGLFQPLPISAANQSTYLSVNYPALLEAACMVFLSGWLKQNYGAQSDSPQQAMSHEAIYEGLKESAKAEEMRRRGLIPDQPMPTPAGAPQR